MQISAVFEKEMTIKNIFQFIKEIYHSNKLMELFSFLVWEIKFQFFSKDSLILKFINDNPLRILTQNSKLTEIQSKSFNIRKSEANWMLVFSDNQENLWGCLSQSKCTLIQMSSKGIILKSFKFKNEIRGLYITKVGNVFCCTDGRLYKLNKKKSFIKILNFSTPKSFFLQDAFTETPNGELFIGEYANIFEDKKWKFVGYIYHSIDNGNNWKRIDFLKKVGVNKHVHILKWSNILNGLILTDGDNQKNIWVNKSKTQFDKHSSIPTFGWKRLNKFHIQKGGYTGIAELKDKIIFGSDYNGGTNFLISTNDMINFDEKIMPNPYRRAFFNRIVIRKNKQNKYELWSTSIFKHSKKIKSLLMLSTDNGNKWKKIIEYDGTQFEISIISNSRKITKELYLLINNKSKNFATTMHICS